MFEFVHHHLHGVGRRKEDGGGVHDLLHRVEAVEFASEDDFANATESDNAYEHVLLIHYGKHVGALVGDDAHELTEVHVGRKGGGVFNNHLVERHEREHGTVLVVREELTTARKTHGVDAMWFEGMNHQVRASRHNHEGEEEVVATRELGNEEDPRERRVEHTCHDSRHTQ